MSHRNEQTSTPATGRTAIYKFASSGEEHIGYIDGDGVIYKLRWGEGVPVGRVEAREARIHIFRNTIHDEKELGTVDEHGSVRSHGLFEGGDLGWLDPDGVVVQGGLILGEEEVGRVAGPQAEAAAGALLLLFLPDDAEASHRMTQRS